MLQTKNRAFEAFLESFQEIDLPITLTEDLSPTFSAENKPFKDELVAQFIAPIDTEIDEFTEFVPCFRLKETAHFQSIVYWKAMLMENKYILANYTLQGEPLDAKVLSITAYSDDSVIRSVATIDEDWNIVIAKGVDNGPEEEYDPTTSKVVLLEIMPDGKIMKTDKRHT